MVEVKGHVYRDKWTKIQISSVYWENNACAHSVYQALSPLLKGPGDEAIPRYTFGTNKHLQKVRTLIHEIM